MKNQNHQEKQTIPFWSMASGDLPADLRTLQDGLSADEAGRRFISYGANRLKPKKRSDVLVLLIGQFKSPIILILLVATGLSFFLHDPADAGIILTIVLVSGLLGFWQERQRY